MMKQALRKLSRKKSAAPQPPSSAMSSTSNDTKQSMDLEMYKASGARKLSREISKAPAAATHRKGSMVGERDKVPGWTAESWLSSLDLMPKLGEALLASSSAAPDLSEADRVKSLDRAAVETALRDIGPALVDTMLAGLSELRKPHLRHV